MSEELPFTQTNTCEECGGTGVVYNVNPAALRQRREKSGLSLRDVAKHFGFSAAYISDIERGNRACPKKILQFYMDLQFK